MEGLSVYDSIYLDIHQHKLELGRISFNAYMEKALSNLLNTVLTKEALQHLYVQMVHDESHLKSQGETLRRLSFILPIEHKARVNDYCIQTHNVYLTDLFKMAIFLQLNRITPN